MNDILEGYARAATSDSIAAYDGLSPEAIYAHVVDFFPSRRPKVADIGAGTGRDAAWFAATGHDVLAVEPVRALREAGRALHPGPTITWLDDRLPDLAALSPHSPFGLITLCAVWQHLTDQDRAIALPRLASLVAPSGVLVMSLRHGEGAIGREVFPASPDATIGIAQASGLRLIRRREADAVQASNQAMGVSWTWLAFAKGS